MRVFSQLWLPYLLPFPKRRLDGKMSSYTYLCLLHIYVIAIRVLWVGESGGPPGVSPLREEGSLWLLGVGLSSRAQLQGVHQEQAGMGGRLRAAAGTDSAPHNLPAREVVWLLGGTALSSPCSTKHAVCLLLKSV